jgi:hypothetical protein
MYYFICSTRRNLIKNRVAFTLTFHAMPKLPHWRHDADTKLTATEPSKRQFGAALRPACVCCRYVSRHDLYFDFSLRQALFLGVLVLQFPCIDRALLN